MATTAFQYYNKSKYDNESEDGDMEREYESLLLNIVVFITLVLAFAYAVFSVPFLMAGCCVAMQWSRSNNGCCTKSVSDRCSYRCCYCSLGWTNILFAGIWLAYSLYVVVTDMKLYTILLNLFTVLHLIIAIAFFHKAKSLTPPESYIPTPYSSPTYTSFIYPYPVFAVNPSFTVTNEEFSPLEPTIPLSTAKIDNLHYFREV